MLLNDNKLIILRAHSEFFGVVELDVPVAFGEKAGEVVESVTAAFSERTVFHDRSLVDHIGAGTVDGDRVERGKHSDVGHDGSIIFGVAVAVRRDIHRK